MNFDKNNQVPTEGMAFRRYLDSERMWMAAEGYEESKEVILRKTAMRVILITSKCENFDASIPYIAMNYFDRYISRHPVPDLTGMLRLDLYILANCCLTLAWKMRDQSFKARKFMEKNDLKELKSHFLAAELAILNGLGWQMRPITALSFVDMLVRKIPNATEINRRFINEIIVQTQGDVTFTKYRPSLIAASAILLACRDINSVGYNRCRLSLLALGFLDEGNLDACTERISAMCADKQIFQRRRNRRVDVGAGGSAQVGRTSQAAQSSQEAETSQTGQRRQVGETSGDGRSSQEEETSEAGRTSLLRESSEGMLTFLFGDAASEAGQASLLCLFGEAPEGGEASEVEETPEDLIQRRRGKEPIEKTSTSEIIPRRATVSEPAREISEIEEVLEYPESESSDDMNFELKWVLWTADNPEDLFIDSARFRPVADPAARAQVRSDHHSATVQKCANCNVM